MTIAELHPRTARTCHVSPTDPFGDTTELRLSGEFDIARLMELRYCLARTVSGDAKNLVIDLADVTFLCAGTVGVLVRTRALLSARGRTLTLRGATGCVQRVLSICGVR